MFQSIYHIRFFHCIGLLAYGKIIWSWWLEVCAVLCNWPQKDFHLVFLMLSCILSIFGVEKSIFWMKGSIAKANSLGQTFCDLHTCLHLFYCSSIFLVQIFLVKICGVKSKWYELYFAWLTHIYISNYRSIMLKWFRF